MTLSEKQPQAEPPQGPAWQPDSPQVLDLLANAEITACDLLPWGSNYTFLAKLNGGDAGPGLAVYKPRRGEAPLYDFPDGTLYRREYGSYVVSQALGWDFIPPTVIRDGPHGIGAVMLFTPSFRGANYFTFREERVEELQRVAAFDCLTNNADRKAGHCLLGVDGRVWGIDHGLTFNAVPKLRTVIWEFRSTPIPETLRDALTRFAGDLEKGDVGAQLRELVASEEMDALRGRLGWLLENRVFPEPGPWRSVPWPSV